MQPPPKRNLARLSINCLLLAALMLAFAFWRPTSGKLALNGQMLDGEEVLVVPRTNLLVLAPMLLAEGRGEGARGVAHPLTFTMPKEEARHVVADGQSEPDAPGGQRVFASSASTRPECS